MTTARSWFSSDFEFRQLCGDARSEAKGESAQEFAAEMVIKAKEHGLDTYLSPKQLAYLCKIAGCDPPARQLLSQAMSRHGESNTPTWRSWKANERSMRVTD